MQLSEQEVIRREKLAKLRELGINPYPAALFPVDTTSKDIHEQYEEGKKVIKIIDKNPAGSVIESKVENGVCIKTFTGSSNNFIIAKRVFSPPERDLISK